MSRSLPTDFVPIRPELLGPGRFIGEGGAAPAQGEIELAGNLHWALAKVRTPIVSTLFSGDSGVGAGVQPYAIGAASAMVRAVWVVPVIPGPWTHWEILALVENTDGAHTATVRFERSDGTGSSITITAGATAWTSFSTTLAMDTGLDTDVLRMKLTNPSSGEVRVHWVEVRPAALSSIPATKFTLDGGETWCPIDSVEVDVQSPLSVALRRRELANIEAIRQSRIETIVGWSDQANFRTPAYSSSGGTYETVLRILFRAGPRRRKLRWGLVGYIPSGSGYVRLSTGTMRAAGTTSVETTLPVGWTTPFANVVLYSDTGLSALDTTPDAWDELFVELKGTTATLLGLTAWLVDE